MRIVTVAGGTLFRVALDWLGDATQWVLVAQLNGLSDPMLTGLTNQASKYVSRCHAA